MGLGLKKVQRVAPQSFIYALRRRFSMLLIALGLIYLGMAISTATHTQPQNQATQQFTISKPASSVLSSSTKAIPNDNPEYAQVFIPQCSYRTVPYKTVYKTAPWLNFGQTMTTGGFDGEERICTSQNGHSIITTVVPPLDKTINTGSYQPPVGSPTDINLDNNENIKAASNSGFSEL